MATRGHRYPRTFTPRWRRYRHDVRTALVVGALVAVVALLR